MTWQKILNWASMVVLFVWAGFLLQVAYWLHYPVNVVDFYNIPAKVLNEKKTVARGEFLEYEVEFQKFENIPAHRITRSLLNDRIVTLTYCESGSLPSSNKRQKTIVRVFIPKNVWPGKYYLKTDMCYSVNPLRDFHETYETEWFTVK